MVFMDRDYTKKKVRSLVAESSKFLYAIPVTKTRAFCEVLSIVSSPLLLIIVSQTVWLCLAGITSCDSLAGDMPGLKRCHVLWFAKKEAHVKIRYTWYKDYQRGKSIQWNIFFFWDWLCWTIMIKLCWSKVIVNSRINYMDGHISQSVVPCHTLNKRILPFGVAARMVHPSTGSESKP